MFLKEYKIYFLDKDQYNGKWIFMLQRKMDSSVDYGTPLVVSKKGWFQIFFNHEKIAEAIPVIRSKVPSQGELWSKLKYFARIETPMRIVGVVVLGTVLGAAYAVTTQNGDKQSVEQPIPSLASQENPVKLLSASLPIISNEISASSENLQGKSEPLIVNASKEPDVSDVINDFNFSQEEDNKVAETPLTLKSPEVIPKVDKTTVALSLVSSGKSFKITHPKVLTPSDKVIDEATYTAIVIPKEFVPEVIEGGSELSEYEQQKILELEKKLALTQERIDDIDMENLKLQGKFDTLVVKNRALSDQLRHIDTVTTSLKNH